MSKSLWSEVDAYIGERLKLADPALAAALVANKAVGLPSIDVSAPQGAFLNLLVKMSGARKILEIGTLGGYSTIWMARALPAGGRLVSLEAMPLHAETARSNIARAGLADRVEVRLGKAADLLPQLALSGAGPFDLVFIDADKPGNPVYLDWAVRLGRPGTVIVLDNVIRDGAVIKVGTKDDSVEGSRAAFDLLNGDLRLTATAIQTVGLKGYDGFVLAVVN
ncbi:MAG: O-methyltransferase [Cucumibacter sp.]